MGGWGGAGGGDAGGRVGHGRGGEAACAGRRCGPEGDRVRQRRGVHRGSGQQPARARHRQWWRWVEGVQHGARRPLRLRHQRQAGHGHTEPEAELVAAVGRAVGGQGPVGLGSRHVGVCRAAVRRRRGREVVRVGHAAAALDRAPAGVDPGVPDVVAEATGVGPHGRLSRQHLSANSRVSRALFSSSQRGLTRRNVHCSDPALLQPVQGWPGLTSPLQRILRFRQRPHCQPGISSQPTGT